MTKEERQALLQTARSSIEAELAGKPLPVLEFKSEELRRKSGTFVTLWLRENLRGCIGYIEPLFPLAQAVQDVAVKAAFEDTRFMPITQYEFQNVKIEISVLSPITLLKDFKDIEIGKHGLVIDSGHRRGLLLPQVATEYNWNAEQFLKQTALKAGLASDAWKKKDVKLYTFTVEKFDESDF
jgi:uncharacterized protein